MYTSVRPSVHLSVRPYVRTYVPKYVRTYVPTYGPSESGHLNQRRGSLQGGTTQLLPEHANQGGGTMRRNSLQGNQLLPEQSNSGGGSQRRNSLQGGTNQSLPDQVHQGGMVASGSRASLLGQAYCSLLCLTPGGQAKQRTVCFHSLCTSGC